MFNYAVSSQYCNKVTIQLPIVLSCFETPISVETSKISKPSTGLPISLRCFSIRSQVPLNRSAAGTDSPKDLALHGPQCPIRLHRLGSCHPGGFRAMLLGDHQWEFQDPKMEVPTIYKAYIRAKYGQKYGTNVPP